VLRPTTCRSSQGAWDYADFATVSIATTSAFSADVGIVAVSA
jgi:hypothetical protein